MDRRRMSSPDTAKLLSNPGGADEEQRRGSVFSGTAGGEGVVPSGWVNIPKSSRFNKPTNFEEYACSPHDTEFLMARAPGSDSSMVSSGYRMCADRRQEEKMSDGSGERTNINSNSNSNTTTTTSVEHHHPYPQHPNQLINVHKHQTTTTTAAIPTIEGQAKYPGLSSIIQHKLATSSSSAETSSQEVTPDATPNGSPSIPRKRQQQQQTMLGSTNPPGTALPPHVAYRGRSSYAGSTEKTTSDRLAMSSSNSRKWFHAGFFGNMVSSSSAGNNNTTTTSAANKATTTTGLFSKDQSKAGGVSNFDINAVGPTSW